MSAYQQTSGFIFDHARKIFFPVEGETKLRSEPGHYGYFVEQNLPEGIIIPINIKYGFQETEMEPLPVKSKDCGE
jgi:hypothetical protein